MARLAATMVLLSAVFWFTSWPPVPLGKDFPNCVSARCDGTLLACGVLSNYYLSTVFITRYVEPGRAVWSERADYHFCNFPVPTANWGVPKVGFHLTYYHRLGLPLLAHGRPPDFRCRAVLSRLAVSSRRSDLLYHRDCVCRHGDSAAGRLATGVNDELGHGCAVRDVGLLHCPMLLDDAESAVALGTSGSRGRQRPSRF